MTSIAANGNGTHGALRAALEAMNGTPSPLIDSDWSHAEQCQRLIAHKAYEVQS